MREDSLSRNIDWVTILFYAVFITAGWLNIFAVVYNPDPEVKQNIFDLSLNSGKQLLWIGSAFILILMIFAVDIKFYSTFAYVLYGIVVLMVIATIFIGVKVNGSRSWIGVGDFRVQPAEFAKLFTALALSRCLGDINANLKKRNTRLLVAGIILLPCGFILLQNETGGVLAFSAFILVLFREGLSPWILITGVGSVLLFVLSLVFGPANVGIGLAIIFVLIVFFLAFGKGKFKPRVFAQRSGIALIIFIVCVGWGYSTYFVINDVLKEHQRKRVMVLVNPEIDKKKEGYQINQSKVAIGSGGFFGQGFLQGTQTKFDFVPEQSTDFIFCTIGEEHGWFGSTVLIILYVLFLIRIINLAERQKDNFARIYGYCVASIIFFHFMVNIGMTIGVFPIIGIPLPFFSYGGSSLWSFTILLFIFLKMDAHRKQVLAH
jgi:rod shape determining protein RodA